MRVANFFLQVNGNAGAAYSGNGGAERNRTADLCSAIAALSQLSYGPATVSSILVELSGIEPLTPCLQSRCSPS